MLCLRQTPGGSWSESPVLQPRLRPHRGFDVMEGRPVLGKLLQKLREGQGCRDRVRFLGGGLKGPRGCPPHPRGTTWKPQTR